MDIDFSGKLNLGIRDFLKIRGLRFLWDSNWIESKNIDFHAIKLKSVIFQRTR